MFATLVNCAAIVLGSLIGLLGAKRIKDGYREVVFAGAGVTTLVIGFSMAFKSANVVYVITSYSIHYTKLYEARSAGTSSTSSD